jgi:hypothetical protein
MAIDWFSTAFDPTSLPKGLRAVYQYWLSRAGDDGLPAVNKFNLLELASDLLPNIAIVDMGPPSEAGSGRYLIVGSNVVSLFQDRVGSGKFSEVLAENRKPLIEDLSEQMAAERRPIYVRFEDTTDQGIEFHINMLILPLALEEAGSNLIVVVYDITEIPD